MLPRGGMDGQLQSRKQSRTGHPGAFSPRAKMNDPLIHVTVSDSFGGNWMARTAGRIALLLLAGVLPFLVFSGSTFAQNRRQPVSNAPSSQTQPPSNVPPQTSDLTKLENDALGWFEGLLRINTTNPPGNELAAAKYIADILKQEGIPSDIIETVPGRGFLVARLSATALPDPSHALLLMGHLDVVGVDRSKWSVDPFGAVVKGGYLYGRGAIDDKAMAIANLAIFVALKRSSAHLNRDVIYLG